MKVLLASDLDGTLIFDNKISDENKKAIRRFKESEGVFVISTGRPFNGVEKVIENLDIHPDYFILNNGALIMDGSKNVVHKRCIDSKVVKEILYTFDGDDKLMSVETGFATYSINLEKKQHLGISLSYIEETFTNFKTVKSFEEIKEDEFTLISLYSPKVELEQVQSICDNLNRDYGNCIVAYRNNKFIDIVPKGCSKGNGVIWISDKENIDVSNVYTIGDSWNDDSMFEVTKNSFTFTYAEEALKDKTEYVVENVAECIDKYILD